MIPYKQLVEVHKSSDSQCIVDSQPTQYEMLPLKKDVQPENV